MLVIKLVQVPCFAKQFASTVLHRLEDLFEECRAINKDGVTAVKSELWEEWAIVKEEGWATVEDYGWIVVKEEDTVALATIVHKVGAAAATVDKGWAIVAKFDTVLADDGRKEDEEDGEDVMVKEGESGSITRIIPGYSCSSV